MSTLNVIVNLDQGSYATVIPSKNSSITADNIDEFVADLKLHILSDKNFNEHPVQQEKDLLLKQVNNKDFTVKDNNGNVLYESNLVKQNAVNKLEFEDVIREEESKEVTELELKLKELEELNNRRVLLQEEISMLVNKEVERIEERKRELEEEQKRYESLIKQWSSAINNPVQSV
jgi:hypothetical protein